MARQSDLLRHVDYTKSSWAVHVRVLRMWEPLYGKQKFASSLELAVSDREGTKMWCTVPKLMIKAVKEKIRESGVYLIKDFFVGLNAVKSYQTKISTHRYKINFQNNTSFVEAPDVEFPPISFDVRSFAEIKERNGVNEIDLIDALGVLVSKEEVTTVTIDGAKHRVLTILLEDLEKNTVECTLWDNYVDHLFDVVNFNSMDRVVILLQFCQAKTFRDKKIISTTRHSETKLWINSDIPIINNFKKSLCGENGDTSSQVITTVSSNQGVSLEDDLKRSQVMTIAELIELDEVRIVWICATVMGIVPSDRWCYLGCKKCSKGVRKEGSKFHCKGCNAYQLNANERYVLEVNIIDETAPTTVVLWDRECFQIYGKTASEMKEMSTQATNLEFPAELQLIQNRKFLFKVQVKPALNSFGNHAYHVIKMTEDGDLILRFGDPASGGSKDDGLPMTEEETPNSKAKESIGDTVSGNDFTPAKRLFTSVSFDVEGDDGSATKIPKVSIKIEK